MRLAVEMIVPLVFSLLAAAERIPILAPDPGPPPPFAPVLNPAVIVIALFFGSAAVLWGVSAYVRGKITRKKLIITTGLLMLFTWGGLLVAMITAPANAEYETWERQHESWKRQEIIGYEGEAVNDPPDEVHDDIIVPKQ